MKGYDFDWLLGRVASLVGMTADDIIQPGRYPKTVKARSILLYRAQRELGISTVALAKRFNLSQPSISQSIKRGQGLIADEGYQLF